MRTVIGCSPGGFPGPVTSPGLPLSCVQRNGTPGSIFFLPSPRTKLLGSTASAQCTASTDAAADSPAAAVCPAVQHADGCTPAAAIILAAPERSATRRRLDFLNPSSESTEASAILGGNSCRCTPPQSGDGGARSSCWTAGQPQLLAEQLPLPLDAGGAQADIRRLLGSPLSVRSQCRLFSAAHSALATPNVSVRSSVKRGARAAS